MPFKLNTLLEKLKDFLSKDYADKCNNPSLKSRLLEFQVLLIQNVFREDNCREISS
jgi:hypothetical protein